MKRMPAGAFKAKCLAIMDEVQAKKETVVITKHGKPVAKLVPMESESADLIGVLAGKLEIRGDILSTGVPWHAES